MISLRTIALLAVLTLLLVSCSRSPKLEGTWKNGDGNLLTFSNNGDVTLGQEGLQGSDSGSYKVRDGTVHVVTKTQSDRLGSFHNEYFLLYRNDSLLLQRVTLYRGKDFHEISLDSLAQRMGKSPQRFAFVRKGGP